MPQEVLAVDGGSTGRVCDGAGAQTMDPIKERGRILARDARTKHIDGPTWFVPSQTGSGGYLVNLAAGTCPCKNFEALGGKCKHIWAAEIKQAGASESSPAPVPRKTYTQDWPTYHHVACREKTIAQTLLKGLCDGVLSPPHPGRGPKPVALGDAVYAMVMRAWVGTSARNACSDVQMAADAGHISRPARANTMVDYYNKPGLTPLLKTLIEESASPLALVETQFAIDSTGFGTAVYRRWYDARYGRERSEKGWIKAHAVVGTRTNIVTAVNITEGHVNDSPQLPALVAATDRRFAVAELSADKAYLSHDNLAAVEAVNGIPYIPFKSSNQGEEGPEAWRRLWATFALRRDEFLLHYHRRSNVEATFSGVKRKFGGAVRSRTFVAQTNEVLCRLLCWNLSCLAYAMHELNIKPVFDLIPAPAVAA